MKLHNCTPNANMRFVDAVAFASGLAARGKKAWVITGRKLHYYHVAIETFDGDQDVPNVSFAVVVESYRGPMIEQQYTVYIAEPINLSQGFYQ